MSLSTIIVVIVVALFISAIVATVGYYLQTQLRRLEETKPSDIPEPLRWLLPVLGEIPAGPPILTEGEQKVIGNMWVDREEAARADFALLVKGDSMRGASLNPGDYALIREQARAEKGDIVAALVVGSEKEVTLKRFDYDDTYVYLYSEPKDGCKEACRLEKQEAVEKLRILGKVVGILPGPGQSEG